ncbi:MAG: hypothetical protein LBE78_03500 [Burkholderiaceae bacterium]|jgi:apolipoprotein N-acyltransferase|nr:hypothetical protein [Burkholderiaceae bacterium]
MRNFGLIALLVVLLIVAWLSTRQVAFVQEPLSPTVTTGTASAPTNVGKQIQRQLGQKIDQTIEQSKQHMPDDAK